MITIDQYLMGRDKQYPVDATQLANAATLLQRINALLADLKLKGIVRGAVSSGYRPAAINKSAGGSKASAHLTCQAVDLVDPSGEAALFLQADHKANGTKSLLTKHDLYMEHPDATQGSKPKRAGAWCHLQSRPTKSGNRVFLP